MCLHMITWDIAVRIPEKPFLQFFGNMEKILIPLRTFLHDHPQQLEIDLQFQTNFGNFNWELPRLFGLEL